MLTTLTTTTTYTTDEIDVGVKEEKKRQQEEEASRSKQALYKGEKIEEKIIKEDVVIHARIIYQQFGALTRSI